MLYEVITVNGIVFHHLVLADPDPLSVHQHALLVDGRLGLLFRDAQFLGDHRKEALPFVPVFDLERLSLHESAMVGKAGTIGPMHRGVQRHSCGNREKYFT